jgi:16S rRNA (guanine527-N7)-methyltransferase
MNLAQTLASGLAAFDLALDTAQQQKLLNYVALIAKWNKVYNLTAVRDPEAMVTQHLLDSLTVLPHLAGPRLIDIGCGAGLPGIPLAIARPEWKVGLLDSNHKKATFLRQACLELGLTNAEVVCERVERYRAEAGFDTVISRAFSDLGEFARLTAHLLTKDGKLYAMKGVYPHDEIGRLPQHFKVQEVIPLTVPGMDANRHLVIMGVEEQ